MKQRLIFATNNRHKVDEIQKALPPDFEVVTLQDAGIEIEIPEPFETLEENAATKAETIFKLTHADCFAEDTGLEVDALKGAPGVRSARFAGEHATYDENNELLLQLLKTHENRNARFRTVIHLIKNSKAYRFEGICKGSIAHQASGTKGFGYDPLFVPEGSHRCFAEMTMEEKNKFSHRRKALDAMLAFLREDDVSALQMKEQSLSYDHKLIEGCRENDRRSQAALYQLHAPKLYAICLRYMGSVPDAQDVLQESFIKIFRAIAAFRGDGSFEGWMRRIVVNTAIEHIRKKHVITAQINEQQEESLVSEAVSAIDHLSEQELLRMIQSLPPGYRSVFNLYVIEGYAHKEIATMLEISEGTSKSQLARARAMLQEKIKMNTAS